jgi:hypothetical protein
MWAGATRRDVALSRRKRTALMVAASRPRQEQRMAKSRNEMMKLLANLPVEYAEFQRRRPDLNIAFIRRALGSIGQYARRMRRW